MAEDFNMKEGILNSLKAALKDDSFIVSIFDMLLGKEGAAKEVEVGLKRASYNGTLNEVVSIHRLYKQNVTEGVFRKDIDKKGLLQKIKDIRKKSNKFMRKVLIRTLKEKGMVASLIYIIKALATAGYPLDDLIAAPQVIRFVLALIRNAAEVAREDETFKVALAEDFEPNENSVNIMVGRFQPFTLGHLKCLKAIKQTLGVPTLLCVIPGNGDSKHPFAGKVQDDMYERLAAENPDLIADVAYVKNAFIEPWVLAAKERGLEPVSWTCGTDRHASYESMVQKHGQNYGLSPEFKVFFLDRADDNISATNVRECLVNDDKEGFMKQMPECLWDMYDEMRNVLVGTESPAYQSITESVAFSDFKRSLDKGLRRLLK